MIKKIILYLSVIVVGFLLPLHYQIVHQDDYGNFMLRQNIVLGIILLTSLLITFFNYENIKNKIKGKVIWIIFEIAGIIGIIFSAGFLWILFEFRHGIGF